MRLEAIQSLLECARSEKEGTLNNELYQEMLVALLGSGTFTDGVAGAHRAVSRHALATRPQAARLVSLIKRTDESDPRVTVSRCPLRRLPGVPL